MNSILRWIFAVACFLLYFLALYIPIQIIVGMAWGMMAFVFGQDQDDLVTITNMVILLAITVPMTAFLAFLLSRKTVRWIARLMAEKD